ncbi:MAG: histidine kinase [Frankiales bacterium]|nr:histidine kinase [Frankiales bacterium]
MGRFGDGLGTSSDLVLAAEQAVEQALEPLRGRAPDLAVVFASGADPDDLAAAGERACALTGAGATLGCTAAGVIGGGRGVEGVAAVSVWVGVLPGASLRTFHLEVMPTGGSAAVIGLPEREASTDEVALLLADPFSFPVDGFVSRAAEALTDLPFLGGVAHGSTGPGSTRLWVDGRTVDRGAVGVLVGGSAAQVLVSQGCRPVGPAMTITEAAGNVVLSLAGQPALARLKQVLSELAPPDQALASSGLLLGVAADEYAEDHDYLVRGILGSEGEGLVVGDLVSVGQTVRLQVRDADVADRDLRSALGRCPDRPGAGALLFSCNGRGSTLFGPSYGGADHDGNLVREVLAADAVAGFFAGGEIGPVAGRSHLHSFTASVLVFP